MTTLSKITFKQAQEVSQLFGKPPPLSEEAMKLLQPSQTPAQFIEQLASKHMLHDAVTFLCHALPKREAIWWGLQCAKEAHGSAPADPVKKALQATEKWVLETTEEARRATQSAAEAAKLETPAGMTAYAVFVSGGSVAPPTVTEEVKPPEHLTPLMVASAIKLCTVQTQPEKADEKLKHFQQIGLDVASGKNVWKK